ncbi:GAP family protein [Actinomadura barringtoniae]|uniref:GAP family protein n=1 Tax=Actinomadura barringtoniae TaxID=1427535 RepID=A0A939PF91_9ACTN|nr:GAP family protein [Actinomadura barringtoniae]MBO2447436.1 GAP family protein [Actinomadura barringtoniae]
MRLDSFLLLVVLAMALALKPWSILTAVLLAAAKGGMTKATAFLVGWVTVLAAIGAASVVLLPHYERNHSRSTFTPYAWVDVALGAALAVFLLWRWRKPYDAQKKNQNPGWVERLDTMPAPLAFALGAFMPSYLLVAAAVNQLLETGWTGAGLAVTIALFVILASAGVAAPVMVPLFKPDQAADIHERWRTWLLEHRRVLAYGLSGMIAAVLIFKGLASALL